MIIWFVLGGVWGWLSIAFQVWSMERLDARPSPGALIWVIGGVLVRLGWIALLLAVALQRGITAGLFAFVGILLARWLMIYRLHKLAISKV